MTWLTLENAESINTFADAQFHYENCAEIRSSNYKGKEIDGVPLMTHRRDWQHKALHKLDDDTYSFRLYDTDVVCVHRNGNVSVDMSYNSSTTDKWAEHWLWKLTGRWLAIYTGSQAMSCSWRWVDEQQRQLYALNVPLSKQKDHAVFYTDSESFVIEPLDQMYDKVHIHNVAPRFVKRIDRSGANDARKPLKPLIDYLTVFSAMPMREELVNELNTEWRERADGWHRAASQQVIDTPDDASLYPFVAAEFHKQDWRYHNMQYQRVYELSGMDTIKKHLYSMMYDKKGLSGFRQLALGESIHARIYTHEEVKQMENSNV